MSELIATAASSINAFTLAKRVAAFNVPVLIQGETGAGKECVAKYIHTVAFGENESAPYVGVNCAAIPENMLESTLFGYDKGAFTGAIASVPGKMELANNGTLLLDEIGDMPLALQAKILRVLQEQQVERLGSNRQIKLNFRLIACTNKNLEQEVATGRFREDLYYRLNVLTLNLPPLRDRPQDIMPLTELFVARFADEQGVARPKLSNDLSHMLTRYGWPGNVRQLKNAVYRALTQLNGYELRAQDILLPDFDAGSLPVGEEAMDGSLDDITRRFERSVLTQLYRSYPSTRKLAKRLGVSHTAIANKLRDYGLSQKKGEE